MPSTVEGQPHEHKRKS